MSRKSSERVSPVFAMTDGSITIFNLLLRTTLNPAVRKNSLDTGIVSLTGGSDKIFVAEMPA